LLRRLIHWLINFCIWVTCDLEVIGLEKIPLRGGCIITANHLGRLDVFLVYKVIPREDIILTIAEKYKKHAIFRLSIKELNGTWIDRFNSDLGALRQVLRRLQKGGIYVIAPEGTRSKNESLINGRPGAAFLATKTNLPVLPVALTGTEDRLIKKNLMSLRRSKVTVTIGDPFTIPPAARDNRHEYLQTSTDEIMCQIAALLPPRYRGIYAHYPRLIQLIRKDGKTQDPQSEKYELA